MNRMNICYLLFSRCTLPLVFCLAVSVSAICQAETYSYDVAGRLKVVTYDDGYSILYTYDDNSNIIGRQVLLLPDSDNDGIPDHIEDANQNGIVDPGETDPNNIDTDGDGIQDGTELGYTIDDVGPATNLAFFQPDLDPDTVTDPTRSDTDGDGYLDGEEDTNHNGMVDPGETDPNYRDPNFYWPMFLPATTGSEQ